MWIEKIQIKNFGKFHEKTIEFEPGLNIVYGANESGKTTIHNFLTGMLFGIEKSRGRAGRDVKIRFCMEIGVEKFRYCLRVGTFVSEGAVRKHGGSSNSL